jgi:amino-acid N-acetyltransferase
MTGISRRPHFAPVVRLLAASGLPVDDLTEAHCENFFCSGPPAMPTGVVGLEPFGDVALLRSLAVAAERRGRGEGGALLAHVEARARSGGIRIVFLLTTTAESFFAAHGYQPASRDTAPPSIRATREFGQLCPASAVFMSKLLSPG